MVPVLTPFSPPGVVRACARQPQECADEDKKTGVSVVSTNL